MKSSILVSLSLVLLTGCMQAELTQPLCEGRPAINLEPLAGLYRTGESAVFEKGVRKNSEPATDRGDGGQLIKVGSAPGQIEFVNSQGASSGFKKFRACDINGFIWMEDVESLGKSNIGMQLVSRDEKQFQLKLYAWNRAALDQAAIPYQYSPGAFGLAGTAQIDNRALSADKVLAAWTNQDYITLQLIR